MKPIAYLIGFCLYYSGLFRLAISIRKRCVKILTYHDIAEKENSFVRGMRISLTPRVFERHLQFLQKHYSVVPLKTALAGMQTPGTADRYVCITFDDGYASIARNALPLLSEFGFSATAFLVGKCAVGREVMWRNRLAFLLCEHGGRAQAALARATVEFDPSLAKAIESAPSVGALRLSKNLQMLRPLVEVESMLSRLEGDLPCIAEKPYLSDQELVELANGGVVLANHSYSHAEFNWLTPDQIESELKPWYREHHGNTPSEMTFFSLPFGHRLRNHALVKEIAVRLGTRCILFSNGLDNPPKTDPYCLGRQHLISSKFYRIFTELEVLPVLRRYSKLLLKLLRTEGPTTEDWRPVQGP